MYHSNVSKIELSMAYDRLIDEISNKTYKLQSEDIEMKEERYLKDILENSRALYMKKSLEENNMDYTESSNIRRLRSNDVSIKDSWYFLQERGLMLKSSRVTRNKNYNGKIKTNLYEVKLTPLIPIQIYTINGDKFIEDKFMEQYTEDEYNEMLELFETALCGVISGSEYSRLQELVKKDDVMKKFFWDIDIEYEKRVMSNDRIFFYPNPYNVSALKDAIFEIKDNIDLLRVYLESLLVIPYYNSIVKTKENAYRQKLYALIRATDSFRFIISIDEGLEYDFNLYPPDGTVLKPLVTKIEVKNE